MNYYGISGERYLVHHGIKGMKWGVRRFQNLDGSLTAAGRKRYENREKDIQYYERNNEASRRAIAKNKRDLDDLNKNGVNSQVFKRAYGNPETDYGVSFESMTGYTRKEALDEMKRSTKKDTNDYYETIKDNNRKINNIKTTPIYEKSYTEKIESGTRAATAITVGGTILSTSLAIAAASKGYITGKTAVKLALAGSLGSLAAGTNTYAVKQTNADRDLYRKES